MIFFPTLYNDEILYSTIARYHIRSGNINYSHTTEEIFGRHTVKSSIYLPSNIGNIVKNLPVNYLGDEIDIINNHTLYPFYSTFLSPSMSDKVLNSMIKENGGDIYSRVGICASAISMPKYLKFCPKCMEEDLKKYGESYWHRIHQVQCVEVCPKHKIILQNSSVQINAYYKQEYEEANNANCVISEKINYSNDIIDKLYNLAKDIEYLLNSNFKRRNIEWYRDNYVNYLMARGLATPKGIIRQDKLISEFKEFYGDEFLEIIQSNIDYTETHNWVSEICRKIRYNIHPARQLLFIRFLKVKIDDFFNIKYEYKPFGDGLWPCFNKASNHYGENIIEDVKIKYSMTTKRITGTFCCKCGYKYLREINIDTTDEKEKTRVLELGEVWKQKLIDLVKEGNLSVHEISNILGLDWNGTYKYIIKLGLSNNFKTSNKKLNKFKNKKNTNKNISTRKEDIYDYRSNMLDILKQNPCKSRIEIKNINQYLYVYLQKNDRQWLEDHLPTKKTGKRTHSNVDWLKRDEEILLKVQRLVNELINTEEIPKRININRIGKTLDIYDILRKHIDKLPEVSTYLNDVIEDREEYIIRKIRWAIKKIDDEDIDLNIESVIYKARIYGKDKIKFKDIIDKEIIDYFELHKNYHSF